jgi:hypothetical protein
MAVSHFELYEKSYGSDDRRADGFCQEKKKNRMRLELSIANMKYQFW